VLRDAAVQAIRLRPTHDDSGVIGTAICSGHTGISDIYSRRLSTVEPVFANVRAQKRMDRFTLRGRLKVTIQWMLYCMVHNIEKILNFGESYAIAVA